MTVTLSQTIGICCHCSPTYFNCGQNILIINSILSPKNYAHVVILYFDSAYLEKEMATHSSTLAWKIPWTEEPGRLQSMGLQRVRHNQSNSACTNVCIYVLILFIKLIFLYLYNRKLYIYIYIFLFLYIYLTDYICALHLFLNFTNSEKMKNYIIEISRV